MALRKAWPLGGVGVWGGDPQCDHTLGGGQGKTSPQRPPPLRPSPDKDLRPGGLMEMFTGAHHLHLTRGAPG